MNKKRALYIALLLLTIVVICNWTAAKRGFTEGFNNGFHFADNAKK